MRHDLIEFLWARLDEAEVALAAYRDHRERGDCVNYEDQNPANYDEWDTCARHIATAQATTYSDVAFGLADIETKRRIIEQHRPIKRRNTGSAGGVVTDCSVCDYSAARYPCPTLRLLASPYADHPDYREEWRP